MNGRGGLAEQLYGALLRLYPGAFRDRFAFEMVQLFGDQLRDARATRSPFGVGAVWFRGIVDLFVTAASERVSGDRGPGRSLGESPSSLARVLGLVGIAGGVFLLAAFVVGIPPNFNVIRLVAFNLGATTVAVGVHGRQAPAGRWISLATVGPAILANAWYLVMVLLAADRPVFPEPDPEFRLIFSYAAVTLWLADAAFGLVALRLGAVSRLAASSLAIGSLLALLGVDRLGLVAGPYAAFIQPLALFGIGLVGFGWILLGLDVAFARRPVAADRSVDGS